MGTILAQALGLGPHPPPPRKQPPHTETVNVHPGPWDSPASQVQGSTSYQAWSRTHLAGHGLRPLAGAGSQPRRQLPLSMNEQKTRRVVGPVATTLGIPLGRA